MKRDETLCTRYGEMLDMIACMAINNGAEPKQKGKKRKNMTFSEIMALR